MTKIAIINYNINNLASVKNAFKLFGFEADIISNPALLTEYDKIVLPGVGAFESAMRHLRDSQMDKALIDMAKSGKPILGICLGMQLLMDKSYEFGEHNGLGLISGEVVQFRDSYLKIPHMGWNKIRIMRENPLLDGINCGEYLYFVHSYYVKNRTKSDIVATCDYGVEFSAVIQKDNIFGIQPHPEKSADIGLKIIKNFVEKV